MPSSRAQQWVSAIRATPLHPQWLLGNDHRTRQAVSSLPAGTVLDIGCADRWVEAVLPSDTDYIALDYPVTGGAMYGARPDLFGDASCLPFGDESVDAVVMLEVLEHLRYPQQALAEIARVLRPGGRLLMSMPFLYPIHDAPHDYQRLTIHGLVRDIGKSGLRLERYEHSLGAAESAGLLTCLALGGMGVEALRQRSPAMVLLPLIAGAVPLINLLAWAAGRLLPPWPALTAGYIVEATRP